MSKTLSSNLDKQNESAGISRAAGILLRFDLLLAVHQGVQSGKAGPCGFPQLCFFSVSQVTMKMLKQNDTDTYWCGIERFGTDRGTRVIVTVYSVGKDTMSTSNQLSWPTVDSSADMMSSDLQKRTHYMLLVFVKVPALLILAGVILWLKRSTQKVPEEQWRHTLCSDLDSELLAKDISP
ncbi:CMRF35-like molecule 7 isoform X2 [Arvicanthis niloticus]|uniref:CMRF35-like molecule 7 isoform X2 n=1 Tax=Arvicanthis niloticus TaxID=61156 RepID=UPI00402B7A26